MRKTSFGAVVAVSAATGAVAIADTQTVEDKRDRQLQSSSQDIKRAVAGHAAGKLTFKVELYGRVNKMNRPGIELDTNTRRRGPELLVSALREAGVYRYSDNKRIAKATYKETATTATFTISPSAVGNRSFGWRAITFGHGDQNADQAPNTGFKRHTP